MFHLYIHTIAVYFLLPLRFFALHLTFLETNHTVPFYVSTLLRLFTSITFTVHCYKPTIPFLSTFLRVYASTLIHLYLPSLYILINQPYRSFLLFYVSTGLRFYWSTFFETFLCPSTFGINHTFSFLRVYASTLPFLFHPECFNTCNKHYFFIYILHFAFSFSVFLTKSSK